MPGTVDLIIFGVDWLSKRVQKEGHVDEEALYKGLAGYYAVAQWQKGDPGQPNTSLQRIAGAILEIGLDYVKRDPSFLDGDSKSQKTVRSILLALEPIDFAERKAETLLIDLFKSSMAVFYNNVDMIVEDNKLNLLLKEIGETFKEQVEATDDVTQLMTLQAFGRDVLQGIVKASASVVLDNTELFLGERDCHEKRFTASVLKAVLEAAKTKPNVFSGRIVVDIYRSALIAVGQNARLLVHDGKREQFLSRFSLLLWTVVIFAGCSQAAVAVKLKQAQDLFNQASKLTILDEDYRDYIEESGDFSSQGAKATIPSLTEDARQKYQLVLDLLKKDVLGSDTLHPDLRINAHALKAVAEWRLKQYRKAIDTAAQGQRLCTSIGNRNHRDCGMLIIVGGLVVNSETLDRFEVLKKKKQRGNLTKEESAELVKKLEFALDRLEELPYPPDKPITIYANQQKLIILGNILDMWSAYSRSDTERERADAIEKAKRICQEFPQDYPSADLTKELARKRLGLDQCGECSLSNR